MKRLLDIVISILALLLLSGITFITIIFIRVKLGTPILFKQERIGYKENGFTIYKFRTMSNDTDNTGKLLPDTKRLTPFGKWLRRLSIDEIPQLFNVLKGDMSIVGPRPLLPRYLPYYTMEERKRHRVRPGITGLAQISGRNLLGWDQRLAVDVEYVENQTFLLDMKILFLTVVKVLHRADIVEDPGEHMLDFDHERKLNPQ